MKKTFKSYTVIWAILLALFNIVVFVTPNNAGGYSKFGGAFWMGYIFITLAFIGQLATAYLTFKAENLQKLFYKIPLTSISSTALILILVLGTVCMIIPNLPNWVGIIACFAVLGFNAIAVIKAHTAADIVSSIDDKIKSKTLFIKSLTVDADGLTARAKSDEIKSECKKVYEAVRYSDPMSNEALSSIESEITLKFSAFSDAVKADEKETAKTLSDEIVILLNDRNKKCKILK